MSVDSNKSAQVLKQFAYIGIILVIVAHGLLLIDPIIENQGVIINLYRMTLRAAIIIFILIQIKNQKNWARRFCILTFIFMFLPLIFIYVLMPEKVLYSTRPLLGFAQWLINACQYAFFATFIAYLFRPSTRRLFTPHNPQLHERIILGISACIALALGVCLSYTADLLKDYVARHSDTTTISQKSA